MLGVPVECPRGELRAVIRMFDRSRVGFLCANHNGQSIRGQICFGMGIDCPPDHAPVECVRHNATETFCSPSEVFGDVGHPRLVRTRTGEVALNQVGDGDPWRGSPTTPTVTG